MSIFEWGAFIFHVLNCLSATTVITMSKGTKSKNKMQAFCKLILKIFFKVFQNFYKVVKSYILKTFLKTFVKHCETL